MNFNFRVSRARLRAKIGLFVALAATFPALCHAAPEKPVAAQIAFKTGSESLARGDFERATTLLTLASQNFETKKQWSDAVQARVKLSQAQSGLGKWDLAENSLLKALEAANQSKNARDLARVQSELGGLYLQTNKLELAEPFLNSALENAQKSGNRATSARIFNSQGNLRVLQNRSAEAAQLYAQSAEIARELGEDSLLARVSVNQAIAATRNAQIAPATQFLADAEKTAQKLDGAEKIEITASIGAGYLALSERSESNAAAKNRPIESATRILESALAQSEKLGNARLISLTTGALGEIAENANRNDEAMRQTRRARFFAQQSGAAHLLYRWEWQMGRLLKREKRPVEAIAAYKRSIATFRTLCNCGGAPAFAGYEKTVRPLYYELADLLLQRSDDQEKTPVGARASQAFLIEARDTIELLKTAELSDYFRDDCVAEGIAKTRDIGTLLNKAAVLYFVPLPDRTDILVEFSSGLQRFSSPVPAATLMARARRLRLQLQRPASNGYLGYSQEIYNWLIQPVEATLRENGVETLIFVLDSSLRTIPMAALHSGESFLVEQFQIAVAPALTLIDPRPLETQNTRVFAGGLSESVQGFEALSNVSQEIDSIERSYATTTLLNGQFKSAQMKNEISSGDYAIVHLASHGEFGAQSANTFLLTYDGKVTLDQLERAIRPRQYRGLPVELLVLSACQTAAGDDRAALGLAGIAVKAGARSAMASLWSVSDEATSEMVEKFYDDLKTRPGASKASALRAAQLQLLKDERFSHPSFWAPYLLIGNWM